MDFINGSSAASAVGAVYFNSFLFFLSFSFLYFLIPVFLASIFSAFMYLFICISIRPFTACPLLRWCQSLHH
jgi:hypothetical protein